jgi:hypothetical protein
LISKTENALGILLGRFPGELHPGVDLFSQTIPPNIPLGLPSSLLKRRPDIVQAEHLLHAQTAGIGVAEALRFPSISLTGIAGFASTELDDLIDEGDAWSVGGGLFAPIFDFNKNKERAKQALYFYQNTILVAFREVENALSEVHTYDDQIAAVERQYRAAKNANFLSGMRIVFCWPGVLRIETAIPERLCETIQSLRRRLAFQRGNGTGRKSGRGGNGRPIEVHRNSAPFHRIPRSASCAGRNSHNYVSKRPPA